MNVSKNILYIHRAMLHIHVDILFLYDGSFSWNVGAKTCLHAFQKNRNNKITLKITDTWFFK